MTTSDTIHESAETLKDVHSLIDFAKVPFSVAWQGYKYLKSGKAYPLEAQATYQKMGIAGMPSPILLKDIFTDIRVFRGESSTAGESGVTWVRRGENLFIEGKPGAGKTTFLKYLTLQALEKPELVHNRVPIFISLNEFSQTGTSLEDFILRNPETSRYLRRFLKKAL